jgi:hypothetical protein
MTKNLITTTAVALALGLAGPAIAGGPGQDQVQGQGQGQLQGQIEAQLQGQAQKEKQAQKQKELQHQGQGQGQDQWQGQYTESYSGSDSGAWSDATSTASSNANSASSSSSTAHIDADVDVDVGLSDLNAAPDQVTRNIVDAGNNGQIAQVSVNGQKFSGDQFEEMLDNTGSINRNADFHDDTGVTQLTGANQSNLLSPTQAMASATKKNGTTISAVAMGNYNNTSSTVSASAVSVGSTGDVAATGSVVSETGAGKIDTGDTGGGIDIDD